MGSILHFHVPMKFMSTAKAYSETASTAALQITNDVLKRQVIIRFGVIGLPTS